MTHPTKVIKPAPNFFSQPLLNISAQSLTLVFATYVCKIVYGNVRSQQLDTIQSLLTSTVTSSLFDPARPIVANNPQFGMLTTLFALGCIHKGTPGAKPKDLMAISCVALTKTLIPHLKKQTLPQISDLRSMFINISVAILARSLAVELLNGRPLQQAKRLSYSKLLLAATVTTLTSIIIAKQFGKQYPAINKNLWGISTTFVLINIAIALFANPTQQAQEHDQGPSTGQRNR